MTLVEAVEKLTSLEDDITIYVAEPWTPHSAATLVRPSDEDDLSSTARRGKFTYFLEASIAREFLDDWVAVLGREPTISEKCARLIEYAINDA